MRIFNTIKWKLLAFSTVLVTLPTLLVGALAYKTFYTETFNNAEANLTQMVLDWRELCQAYLANPHGTPQERQQQFQKLFHKMARREIYRSGYLWILDDKGNYVVSKKRRRDGENILNQKDLSGKYVIREFISTAAKSKPDSTFIRYYSWQNPDDRQQLHKLSAIAYLPEKKWTIGASAYKKDFLRGLKAIRNYILMICIIAIVCGSALAYYVADRIARPIMMMTDISIRAADGDLEARMSELFCMRRDEVGQLADSFNKMIITLKNKIEELTDVNEKMELEAKIRQEAEDKLCELQDEIIDISRRAGMSEIATGVIHDVGNVLTSVNISANIMEDNLVKFKFETLHQLVDMMKEHLDDLDNFLQHDEIGKHLFEFITKFADSMKKGQEEIGDELVAIKQKIEHIRIIIQTQQEYAQGRDIRETLNIHDVIEDAIRIDNLAIKRRGIELVRDFQTVPDINIHKHKLLQIVTNLVKNYRHAFDQTNIENKMMTFSTTCRNDRIILTVKDNGVGISEQNLKRIFEYGFTTHKEGHGFGLYSSAKAANELGGKLSAHSDGEGQGAVFTLELPMK